MIRREGGYSFCEYWRLSVCHKWFDCFIVTSLPDPKG